MSVQPCCGIPHKTSLKNEQYLAISHEFEFIQISHMTSMSESSIEI